MKTFILSSLLLSLTIGHASARQLTPAQALERARSERNIPQQSIQNINSTTASEPTPVFTMSSDDRNTLYVFNNGGTAGGFMVVSADDATPKAVLGYSDTGYFDPQSIPESMEWWLGGYSKQIAAVGEDATEQSAAEPRMEPMASTKIARRAIAPIVHTLWNQTAPYNIKCPTINGHHCPTGCVATAMAQVMMVHQWPVTGTGSHSYTPPAIDSMLTMDFSQTTFEWDLMKDSYSASATDESAQAVATLMYACGVAVNMNYHATASGSNFSTTASSLIKYFDYDQSLTCLTRDYYDLETWTNMIYSELEQGYPVLYGGQNNTVGHAFVCDGYSDDDYFHINWGWGGTSNGYFLLTALDPAEQGVGGSAEGYNMSQQIIIGMRRATDDSSIVPVFDLMSDFETATATVSRTGSSATVRFKDTRGIFNNSVGTVKVNLGAKLVDDRGMVSYVEVARQQTFVTNQGLISYNIPASDFPQDGTYVVSPAVKLDNGEWYDMHVKMNNVGTLNLTATPTTLTFTPGEESSIKVEDLRMDSPLYSGATVMVKASLVNQGDEEYYQDITPVLVKDDAEVSQNATVAVDVLAGESEDVAWVGKFTGTLSTGEYELYLVDGAGKTIGGPTMVTLESLPQGGAAATATTILASQAGRGVTTDTPVETDLSQFSASVKVSGTSGYFAHPVDGDIYYTPTQRIAIIPGEFVGLAPQQEKEINFSADLSDLEPDHTYMFVPNATSYGQLGMPTYFRAQTMADITEVTTPVEIGMWPNPATDVVRIDAAAGVNNVDIYAIGGYQVISHTADGSMAVTIDVSHLPAGLYAVRVTDGAGATHTIKLIKR